MILREIMRVLEEDIPTGYACDWDNVGLLVGRKDKEVKKIYIALDATDEVIEEAIRMGADLLLTHHPMIFSALKKINDDNFITKRILKLIQSDISYYAMHTNYDVARMWKIAAEILDMESCTPLEVTYTEGDTLEGIGCVGNLGREVSLVELAGIVKERFGLPGIHVFGDKEMKVQKLALCPGSGKSETKAAIKAGAQVFITGDIDHHTGIDAVAQQMAIIDAGHYGIEHIYIEDMRLLCEKKFPELTICAAKTSHPFWTV